MKADVVKLGIFRYFTEFVKVLQTFILCSSELSSPCSFFFSDISIAGLRGKMPHKQLSSPVLPHYGAQVEILIWLEVFLLHLMTCDCRLILDVGVVTHAKDSACYFLLVFHLSYFNYPAHLQLRFRAPNGAFCSNCTVPSESQVSLKSSNATHK